MMRLLILLGLGALLVPGALRAQSATDLLDQGIRAYSTREYDGGAWLLRRALSVQGADGLSRGDVSRALMYLAATELARNERDSAVAAVRRLIVADPKFRPDPGTFPSGAIALLQDARRTAPTVSIRTVGDTAIRPGQDAFIVRLGSSMSPEVTAAVTSSDGRVVRTLYQGTIRDSVDVSWKGVDMSGNPPPPGSYAVTVTPSARDRRNNGAAWTLRLPFEVVRTAVDTMPIPAAPPDSMFRPERGDYQGAWRALAPGILAGFAIVVLPKIVASGDHATSARLVVGGTVTAAGIAAFLSHRPGRTLPANTQYNRNLRDSWRRNVSDIQRRNADRLRQARLVIRPGAPVLTSEAP